MRVVVDTNVLISAVLKGRKSRDVKDAKFLACVIVADADSLITGDKDFDGVQKIGKATIISVSSFKKLSIDTDEGEND